MTDVEKRCNVRQLATRWHHFRATCNTVPSTFLWSSRGYFFCFEFFYILFNFILCCHDCRPDGEYHRRRHQDFMFVDHPPQVILLFTSVTLLGFD